MQNTVFIFDFDGTIADTHRFICEVSNRLCEEFHYDSIDFDELEQLKDKSSQEIIRYLKVPILKIPAIIAKGKREFYKEIASLKPIEGLNEVLHKLKALGNYMGILSSNSSENIANFLKHHNLDIFEFVHTTTKVWSKNTSLKKLIKNNGFSSKNIVYIGDEIRDIVAARRLGIKVAAVTWGYNSSKSLKKYKPDYILDTPEDLFKLCSSST